MTAVDKKGKLIAIAGNIGSGKTSLAKLVEKYFKWNVFYELPDDNPYIFDFYKDMQRWAFHLQIFFLQQRFNHIMKIMNQPGISVIDRTIYEDAYVFAKTLYEKGLMDPRDYTTYTQLFKAMIELIPYPDVVVYLKASVPTLVDQIYKRGRPYERFIDIDYLGSLNDNYEQWIKDFMKNQKTKVIIVDMDRTNFVDNEEHRSQVLERIRTAVQGLFDKVV